MGKFDELFFQSLGETAASIEIALDSLNNAEKFKIFKTNIDYFIDNKKEEETAAPSAQANTSDSDGIIHLLMEAAYNGMQNVLEHAVNKGIQLSQIKKSDQTLLHAATQGGELDAIKFLVGQGLSLSVKTAMGLSLLHVAAACGHLSLVQWFSENGLLLSEKTSAGEGVLEIAIVSKHRELIDWLLSKGFKLSDRNALDRHAMHHAAKGGNQEIIEKSLAQGMSLYDKDKAGNNVLHIAGEYFQIELIEWLLVYNRMDFNAKNDKNETVFHLLLNFKLHDIQILFSNETQKAYDYLLNRYQNVKMIYEFSYILAREGIYIAQNEAVATLGSLGSGLLPPEYEGAYINHDGIMAKDLRKVVDVLLEKFNNDDTVLKTPEQLIQPASSHLAKVQLEIQHLDSSQITHQQKLILLDFSNAVYMVDDYRTKISLHESRFHADNLQSRRENLMLKMKEYIPLATRIYKHPKISNGWVRVRIWHSGYYQGNNDLQPNYVPASSSSTLVRMAIATASDENLNIGHVSLETASDYISFWPAKGKKTEEHNAHGLKHMIKSINNLTKGLPASTNSLLSDMHSEGQDSRKNKSLSEKHKKEPDFEAVFYSLNVNEINKCCSKIIEDIIENKLQFSLIGANRNTDGDIRIDNCVTISYRLLIAGGFRALKEHTLPVDGILTPYWLQSLVTLALAEENNRFPAFVSSKESVPKNEDVPALNLIPKYKVINNFTSSQGIKLLKDDELIKAPGELDEYNKFYYDGADIILSFQEVKNNLLSPQVLTQSADKKISTYWRKYNAKN